MQQYWKGIGRLSTLGLEVSLSAVAGLVGGVWLDRKFETDPWLTLIGFGFGIAAGGRAIYRAIQVLNREALEEEANERAERKKYHDTPPRSPPGDAS